MWACGCILLRSHCGVPNHCPPNIDNVLYYRPYIHGGHVRKIDGEGNTYTPRTTNEGHLNLGFIRFSGCEVLEWPDEALPVFSDEALGNFDFCKASFKTSQSGGWFKGGGYKGALGNLREA